MPVSGWPLPRTCWPVSRLVGRIRLSLAVGSRPWLRSGPGPGPARPVLARSRLLSPVRAGAATLAGTGRHGARAGGRPLLGGLVSGNRPTRPGSRWPARRRPLGRRPRSARCLPGEVLSLVPLGLLTAGMPGTRIARIRIPAPRPGGRGAAGIRTRSRCVRIRSLLRVVKARRPRAARGRRALLARAGAGAGGSGAGTGWARPGAANARHRVLGTLPGPVGRSGIVRRLPARPGRVAGPGRHAALRPGSHRPGRHVRGAGPLAVSAARGALVAGINGVGVGFQVRVALVGVAVRVGGVASPAVRASVRPAALTIHPAPPGPSVRRSPPKSSVGRARLLDGIDG
jgi:hypothetical protein